MADDNGNAEARIEHGLGQVSQLEVKLHEWLLQNAGLVEYRLPLVATALMRHTAVIINLMPGTPLERQQLKAALIELLEQQLLAGEKTGRPL